MDDHWALREITGLLRMDTRELSKNSQYQYAINTARLYICIVWTLLSPSSRFSQSN